TQHEPTQEVEGTSGPDGHDDSPRHQRHPVKFDLAVRLGENARGLSGEVQYSTALFDPETADRIAGHLVALLRAVAAAPGRRLSELPMLTPVERQRLVHDWNDTVAPVPAAGGVHELIAARAATHPDAVAAVCDGRSVTYAGLMARANR